MALMLNLCISAPHDNVFQFSVYFDGFIHDSGANLTNLTYNFFNSIVYVEWVGGSIVRGFWSALKQNLDDRVYSNCGLTKN